MYPIKVKNKNPLHKNTLYITFDGLSDPLGQSQILPYLRGIAPAGYHIHILSCEKKTRIRDGEAGIRAQIGNLPVTWHYILYDEAGGMLSRLLYIRKLHQLSRRIHREKQIHLTHCRSYLAALIGFGLKREYGIPFIFDMRGFWADERIDGNIWKKNNLLHKLFFRYFKDKEKQFIRQADAIVSLTRKAIPELTRQYPLAGLSEKISVIPCCTDTRHFDPEHVQATGLPAGISPGDHLLIYTGSVGTWYYTREMIDCILAWKERIPAIRLLILTKDQDALQTILSAYTPEQRAVVHSGSCAYHEVASYLALARAAIFFIKPSYSKMASSPTKMAECWAMDLPIITNTGIGDNDLFFGTYQGGVLINDFSRQDYLRACEAYLSLSAPAGFYRQIALDHFDTQSAILEYTAIYQRLAPTLPGKR